MTVTTGGPERRINLGRKLLFSHSLFNFSLFLYAEEEKAALEANCARHPFKFVRSGWERLKIANMCFFFFFLSLQGTYEYIDSDACIMVQKLLLNIIQQASRADFILQLLVRPILLQSMSTSVISAVKPREQNL